MDVPALQGWFGRRRVLRDWVAAQQPQMSTARLRSLFYGDDESRDPDGDPDPDAGRGADATVHTAAGAGAAAVAVRPPRATWACVKSI